MSKEMDDGIEAFDLDALRDPGRVMQATAHGVPGAWVRRAVVRFNARDLFVAVLDQPSANFARVYRRKGLSTLDSEKVLDTVRRLAYAEAVFGQHTLAQEWLRTPMPALDGHRPLDLMTTFEGRGWVSQILGHIETGDFS